MEFRSLGLGLQTPSLSSGLRVSAFGSHKQGFGVRAMISGFYYTLLFRVEAKALG